MRQFMYNVMQGRRWNKLGDEMGQHDDIKTKNRKEAGVTIPDQRCTSPNTPLCRNGTRLMRVIKKGRW